jgi:mono/diheme cytochrome c family protein
MHALRISRAVIRLTFGAAICAFAVTGTFAVRAQAGQARTPAQGAYAADQATRGAALYKMQCVECHGAELEGVVGPPLAGPDFLSSWAGKSMSDLAEKIRTTMPLNDPGTLTAPQSLDLVAYILQAGKFPAGPALSAATAASVALPGGTPAAAPASAGAVSLAPAANLAQLMRGVTFPNANIIFNTQLKDPATDKPKMPVPYDYVLWGQTVYYGWQSVDQAALALQETTPLFLLPGRRCQNGRPVPVNKPDFQKFTQDLIDYSKELYKASQARNVEMMASMAENLNNTCANCHKVYRDVGTSEGGGLGTDRCKQ